MTNQKERHKEKTISQLAMYPLTLFLIGLSLGLVIDLFFPVRLMSKPIFSMLGFLLIVASSVLVFWTQGISHKFRKLGKQVEVESHHFKRGPYRFSRHPSYLGVTFLLIGFGMLINSVMVLLFTLITFLVIHFVFIEKEEKRLEQKHKHKYLEYKKSVRPWL